MAEIEALYKSRVNAFVRFVAAMLRDRELARDVVQDAFAKALRQRQGFRAEGSLEAWMWSAVINTARNASRSRALRSRVTPPYDALDAAADSSGSAGPDSVAELDRKLNSDRSVVRELVAKLPERQRECVFLYYFADLDYATIAATLHIKPGTVAASLNAARETLRQGLEAGR